MEWLRNSWYCAMFGDALPRGGVDKRTLLDEAIVLWRGQDGIVHAMEDRCPHRYAPLSMGRQVGANRIRCNYHGLEFDGTGRCVHNPHGRGELPAAAPLKVYSVHEYCGTIWLWMGTGAPDSTTLPDMWLFEPNSALRQSPRTWLALDVPFELMIDNLMDLSHAALLHENILGNEESISAETTFEQDDDKVSAYRMMRDIPAPEFFDLIYMADGRRIDMWHDASWLAPANVVLDVGCTDVGSGRDQGTSVLALHILTPVTQSSCMYHIVSAQRNRPARDEQDEGRIQARLAELRQIAFAGQDGPMVAAQYQVIQRAGEFRPSLLPGIDQAAAQWRRRHHKLIMAERSAAEDVPVAVRQ